MKKVLKKVFKTAVIAASVLPYQYEKGEDGGVTIKSLLYEVESRKVGSNNSYTISLLPTLGKQIELVRGIVAGCEEKLNDPENEKMVRLKNKLNVAKERIEELKKKMSSKEAENIFDEAETMDEETFAEEESFDEELIETDGEEAEEDKSEVL